jgi:hypothetical protein
MQSIAEIVRDLLIFIGVMFVLFVTLIVVVFWLPDDNLRRRPREARRCERSPVVLFRRSRHFLLGLLRSVRRSLDGWACSLLKGGSARVMIYTFQPESLIRYVRIIHLAES